jgi:peptidoglycan/xylan/chitin deacetylase (PgdA/CDA1 family)
MIAILAYHSLDFGASVLSTSPGVFAEQMKFLHDAGIKVICLNDVPNEISASSNHANAVAITFDDGFRNVYEHALPILQSYDFPATVFPVTDYCEKTNAWPGQTLTLEREPLLRWREIREMSQTKISFGSHTRTHPNLKHLPIQAAEEELVGSKKAIAEATGRAVDTLAYPYGAYNAAVKNLATRHFRIACSTHLGFVTQESDLFALERIEMYYFQSLPLFRHLFSPITSAYIGLRRQLRRLAE